MNDAWARAQDPATTAAELYRMAADHPELHATLLQHPNMYPELRAWMIAALRADGADTDAGDTNAATITAPVAVWEPAEHTARHQDPRRPQDLPANLAAQPGPAGTWPWRRKVHILGYQADLFMILLTLLVFLLLLLIFSAVFYQVFWRAPESPQAGYGSSAGSGAGGSGSGTGGGVGFGIGGGGGTEFGFVAGLAGPILPDYPGHAVGQFTALSGGGLAKGWQVTPATYQPAATQFLTLDGTKKPQGQVISTPKTWVAAVGAANSSASYLVGIDPTTGKSRWVSDQPLSEFFQCESQPITANSIACVSKSGAAATFFLVDTDTGRSKTVDSKSGAVFAAVGKYGSNLVTAYYDGANVHAQVRSAGGETTSWEGTTSGTGRPVKVACAETQLGKIPMRILSGSNRILVDFTCARVVMGGPGKAIETSLGPGTVELAANGTHGLSAHPWTGAVYDNKTGLAGKQVKVRNADGRPFLEMPATAPSLVAVQRDPGQAPGGFWLTSGSDTRQLSLDGRLGWSSSAGRPVAELGETLVVQNGSTITGLAKSSGSELWSVAGTLPATSDVISGAAISDGAQIMLCNRNQLSVVGGSQEWQLRFPCERLEAHGGTPVVGGANFLARLVPGK